MVLAGSQAWFRDLQPWIDFKFAQGTLIDGTLTRSADIPFADNVENGAPTL